MLIDRARPHPVMDGLPVISWMHFLDAKSKVKPGRAIGIDGSKAEAVQRLSSRGILLSRRIFNVTSWASTSPKTWTLSLAACLPKDRAMQKAVVAQGRPMAPGMLKYDAGQSLQCIPETCSIGQHSQSHPILTVVVLRVVPSTPMRGHDPDQQTAHGEKQGVARETARHVQAGHKEGL